MTLRRGSGFFRPLENSKITHRVIALSLIGLSAVIALIAVVLWGNRSLEQAQAHYFLASNIDTQVNAAKSQLQNMQHRLDAFLRHKNIQDAQAFQNEQTSVSIRLSNMDTAPLSSAAIKQINSITDQVASSGAIFDAIISLRTKLGLTADQGLEGNLRSNVHAIETLLKAQPYDPLTVKMLMMRRHEKDFMMRGAQKYIDRVALRKAEFVGILNDAPLPSDMVSQVITSLDTYVDAFNAFAQTSLELGKQDQALSSVFTAMLSSANTLSDISKASLTRANEIYEDEHARLLKTISVSAAVIFALLILAGVAIARSINKQMDETVVAVETLAKGDLGAIIPFEGMTNEVGQLSAALSVFKHAQLKTKDLEAQAAEDRAEKEKNRAQDEKRRLAEANEKREKEKSLRAEMERRTIAGLETLSSSVQDAMSTASSAVDVKRLHLTDTAAQMSDTASAMSSAIDKVDETGATNKSIAARLSERAAILQSTIKQILEEVTTSQSVSTQAQLSTQTLSEGMERLTTASDNIVSIVALIEDIASKTNLLALNATIEAARAGEAGKGFSVVASQVKSLAGQTQSATADIQSMIEQLQSEAHLANETAAKVSEVIETLASSSKTIAQSVENQSSATDEMVTDINAAQNASVVLKGEIETVLGQIDKAAKASKSVKEEAAKLGDDIVGLNSSVIDTLHQTTRTLSAPEDKAA